HWPPKSRPAKRQPRVIRVVLTVCRSLPVFPDKQTFSKSFGISQTCHNQTHAPQQNRRWSIDEIEWPIILESSAAIQF
ncbi:MAG: hypothetical protein ACJ8E2_00690, partial [Bradyrhizobium sp.]